MAGDEVVLAAVREVVDNAGAGRVFGAPVTQGDTVVLPVAKVVGGAGGGSGSGPVEGGEGHGMGSGAGLIAKPLGVYVIKDGDATWRPAVDVNRAILGGQLVAVAALLVVRALIRSRRGR